MNTVITFVVCACVMASSLVTSLPADYPIPQLHHYEPTDACLFMCSMCFDDMHAEEMMNCANRVCFATHPTEMAIGMFKLGQSCKSSISLPHFGFEGKPAEK
ncbi:uncharacterized protein LOC128207856 [Mya arenaria]|uniref:uncharacterized protein LOC128207856 n=1 Tax=Mya arenaria TaxID=6604 RepID=UPI0022E4F78A|nr:uncharacterized protein LOC128207856 [Mya arenaria]